MQIQPIPAQEPQFSIQELEQIEAAINASQRWLATLYDRRNNLTAELEKITRPQEPLTKLAFRTNGPGLEYLGKMTHHWSYIDIHIDLLRRLWTEFPKKREAMAEAMGIYGNTRAYVARTREMLFPGQPSPWAKRYSRPLVDGWHVDTNLSRERMRRILPAAVRAAGLSWGHDVKIFWRANFAEMVS